MIKNDPYKVSNSIVMEINNMAGQIFELSNCLNKLMHLKPKRITKLMLEEHSKLIDIKYGENILRHVI